MKKRIAILAAVVAAGWYGTGFLAANGWRVPPQVAAFFIPAAAQADARPMVAQGGPADPLSSGGAAFAQPDVAPALAAMQYRNIREPATLPPAEVARVYELDGLPQAGDHLLLNQRTRVTVENLFSTLSREEIVRSQYRLEEAVALHAGPQVAAEFSALLGEYVNYRDAITAIDSERNAQGLTVADAPDDDALIQRLQNDAFGKDKAAALFQVERETRALMAKQAAALKGSAAAPGPEQVERMNAEYLTVLRNEENR